MFQVVVGVVDVQSLWHVSHLVVCGFLCRLRTVFNSFVLGSLGAFQFAFSRLNITPAVAGFVNLVSERFTVPCRRARDAERLMAWAISVGLIRGLVHTSPSLMYPVTLHKGSGPWSVSGAETKLAVCSVIAPSSFCRMMDRKDARNLSLVSDFWLLVGSMSACEICVGVRSAVLAHSLIRHRAW